MEKYIGRLISRVEQCLSQASNGFTDGMRLVSLSLTDKSNSYMGKFLKKDFCFCTHFS